MAAGPLGHLSLRRVDELHPTATAAIERNWNVGDEPLSLSLGRDIVAPGDLRVSRRAVAVEVSADGGMRLHADLACRSTVWVRESRHGAAASPWRRLWLASEAVASDDGGGDDAVEEFALAGRIEWFCDPDLAAGHDIDEKAAGEGLWRGCRRRCTELQLRFAPRHCLWQLRLVCQLAAPSAKHADGGTADAAGDSVATAAETGQRGTAFIAAGSALLPVKRDRREAVGSGQPKRSRTRGGSGDSAHAGVTDSETDVEVKHVATRAAAAAGLPITSQGLAISTPASPTSLSGSDADGAASPVPRPRARMTPRGGDNDGPQHANGFLQRVLVIVAEGLVGASPGTLAIWRRQVCRGGGWCITVRDAVVDAAAAAGAGGSRPLAQGCPHDALHQALRSRAKLPAASRFTCEAAADDDGDDLVIRTVLIVGRGMPAAAVAGSLFGAAAGGTSPEELLASACPCVEVHSPEWLVESLRNRMPEPAWHFLWRKAAPAPPAAAPEGERSGNHAAAADAAVAGGGPVLKRFRGAVVDIADSPGVDEAAHEGPEVGLAAATSVPPAEARSSGGSDASARIAIPTARPSGTGSSVPETAATEGELSWMPDTTQPMGPEAVAALHRWGDDASAWGGVVARSSPLPCGFPLPEIKRANAHLMARHPWLVLAALDGADASATAHVHIDGHDTVVHNFASAPRTAEGEIVVNVYGTVSGTNWNEHLTQPLGRLLTLYEVLPDADVKGRMKQLEHAIGALVYHPERITTVEQARGVPGVGPHTLDKIAEILATGTLARVDALASSERVRALQLFCKLLWVGPLTAARWYDAGFRTLEDLRLRGQHLLSHPQRLGLRYWDDLQCRVPRAESEAVAAVVQREARAIIPDCLCVLGGSYRRGQASSSDFDFVLAAPPPFHTVDLLPELYRRLRRVNLITDDLVGSWMLPGSHDEPPTDDVTIGRIPPPVDVPLSAPATKVRGGSDGDRASTECHTYFGICKLAGFPGARHRRIDLKCFEWHEAPFALIAWTGNTPLSRSLREYAVNLGYVLDELSLVPIAVKAAARESASAAAASVPCRTEYDVFSFLGLRFIPPSQRSCFARYAGAGTVASVGCGVPATSHT